MAGFNNDDTIHVDNRVATWIEICKPDIIVIDSQNNLVTVETEKKLKIYFLITQDENKDYSMGYDIVKRTMK